MKMPRTKTRGLKRSTFSSVGEEGDYNDSPLTKRSRKAAKLNPDVEKQTEKKRKTASKKQESNTNSEPIAKRETNEKTELTQKRKGISQQRENLLIGCHVSAAGGVQNSVGNAVEQEARAFAMFLTNQRQWNSKPLEDDIVDKFRKEIEASGIPPHAVVPHGIYLMNCASPNPEALEKSRAKLLEEVRRCERLGIHFYNFHPGSTLGQIERDEGIRRIAENINSVLDATENVTLLIENMSGQKNTIGSLFEELRGIIDRVEDKSRIGVCLDTCHMFAAGFDLRSPEAYRKTMEKFDKVVGLRYLKAIHLNDSKAGLGAHLDRHADIGTGMIGLEGFRNLVNDPRMLNIPMVLETPGFQSYDKQIRLLYSLVE